MNLSSFNFSDYAKHSLRNLFRAPDTRYRTHRNHTIWTLVQLFGFPVFALFHWTFLFLDKLFRRGVSRKPIERPVFIIGSYRSGSTFLQRLMGMDVETFSSGTTWEMMFAPSVLQRQAVKGLFAVDKKIGKPIRRLLYWAEGEVFHEKSAHTMGLLHHEEDEAFFIHNYASCFLFFVNPYLEESWKYHHFDREVDHHRRRLDMDFYHQMVQRHMYSHPESRFYLSKSPTFSSRFMSLYERYPDARFIYLARHPLDVIPSLMNWFTQVWSSIEKDGVRFPFRDFVIDFVYHWYVEGLESLERIPSDQVKIVLYDDLVADPFHTVEAIYRFLEIDMPESFRETLSHEKARAKRHWKPKVHSLEIDKLDPEELYRRFRPVFDRFGFGIEEYIEE
jgi:hypothetical protein